MFTFVFLPRILKHGLEFSLLFVLYFFLNHSLRSIRRKSELASSSMALPFNLQTETLLTWKSPNEKSRSIQCFISETVFNLLRKYNSLKELT